MSYRNAIPDIQPGTSWHSLAGACVCVVAAAAGYVVVRYPGGLRETLHERDFRAAFSAPYDREKVRSQFTMSLANLAQFRAYWMPGHSKIVARSVSCSRQFRVPDGAIYIGTYAEPCRIEDFFGDLDEMLRELADGFVPWRAGEAAAK